MDIARIFLGIVIIGLGVCLIYYSAHVARIFGKWHWAEVYLGGTRQAYVLIGFVAMIVGFLIMFGMFEGAGEVKELKMKMNG